MLIEVYADLACPWCFIGLRRLNAALAALPQINAERLWRPYLLQPDFPAAGMDWTDFVNQKFGGMERAGGMFERVSAEGAKDGIDFRFENISRAPNTADAQRLILLAQESGKGMELAESFFSAHFSEGKDLNDADELIARSKQFGIAAAEAAEVLNHGKYRDALAGSLQQAARLGINGVPFYVIDGKYAISGAQPVDYFVQALKQIAGEGGAGG